MNANDYLKAKDWVNAIAYIKGNKTVKVPKWSDLIKEYEQSKHAIMDPTIRKDKFDANGNPVPVARIPVGMQKLAVKRMNEFTFAIPVKRIYKTEGDESLKEIAQHIEAIYTRARIDSENKKRGLNYYATCEIATFWYPVKKKNNYYGFDSEYKLKCKTFSPMDGYELYPTFDRYGDMEAMSIEYRITENGKTVTFFETWTDTSHYVLINKGSGWESEVLHEEIDLGKNPMNYLSRSEAIYNGLNNIVHEIEFTLSRNADVIAYNSAPVLEVKGDIDGAESKGDEKRVWRVEGDGGIRYVTWDQANAAISYQIESLTKLFWAQVQIPDLSFENIKGMGTLSGEAIKGYLTDAHLKVGDEMSPFLEMFDREANIIKAFYKKMNPSKANDVDRLEIEHIITPFVQNDESAEIDKLSKANGGKPVISQLESIEQLGWSKNPEETLKQIQKEEEILANTNSMIDVFNTAQ